VFEQLDTRIALYYPKQKEAMFTILDFLSKQQFQIQEEEIINSIDVETREVRDFLRTLSKDQYLTRTIIDEKRYYEFKYKIFRKWWKLNKV
jgi:transcription initiation factor IIE alpha subunit